MNKLSAVVLATIFSCLFVTTSHAQEPVSLGTLTCSGGEGVGLIVGSSKSYDCTFSHADGREDESYQATVTKIGLDIGVTGKTTIVWTVFSVNNATKPLSLAGNFSGIAADASLGFGGGAKVLVGGSNKSITLQPLSIQGQTGVNLAVGVGAMTLR